MFVQFYRLLLLVVLVLPSLAAAEDMSHCIKTIKAIKPSTGNIATALENICKSTVYMFWCHTGTGDKACGETSFYKSGRKIEPDEQYFNKYNLPDNVDIRMGACSSSKVSFGANGIGSYSCLGTDEPAIQPSDDGKITCNDGRKLPYQWRQKHANDKVAIVRLTTDKRRYWVKVNNAEFNRFTAKGKGAEPAVFKARICGEKLEAPSSYATLKSKLIKKINEDTRDKKASCLDELAPRSEECLKILHPQNTNAGTGERL